MKRYDDNVLKRLLDQGQEEGNLSVTAIYQAFEDADISSDQLDQFLETCSKAGIEIIDNQNDITDEDNFADNVFDSENNSDYYLDDVKLYLDEICKIPLLSPEEEILLAKAIKEGSPEEASKAKKHLTEANLRLVFSIAKKYAYLFNQPIMDVVQDGNIGLMKAVEKFDYTKGFKFSTYATHWVKQNIRRAHHDTGRAIRLPVHMCELINNVKREIGRSLANTGTIPPNQVIAKNLNISEKAVEQAIANSQSIASLDDPIGNNEGSDSFLVDFIPDKSEAFSDTVIKQMTVKELIDNATDYLTEREFNVIQKRTGLYDGKVYTLEEIAHENGVTRERIRQIEDKALKKIRNHNKQYR